MVARFCSRPSAASAAGSCPPISSSRPKARSSCLILSLILYVSFFDVQRWRRDLKADRVEATRSGPAGGADKIIFAVGRSRVTLAVAMSYCVSRFRTVRRPTLEVKVGGVGVRAVPTRSGCSR